MVLQYVVSDLSNYKNIRQVLKNEFNISNRLITKLKKNGFILLNGNKTYLDKLISLGDVVTCVLDFNEVSENIVPVKMDLDIIYEDDSFLVINKKPGIPVHPSILHYSNSLSNGVKFYFDSIGLKRKIRPVNRLDRDTTGLVIFAKNEYIQECLINQMKRHTFYKEYIAILEGILDKPKGTINAPIARKTGSIIERCIDTNGENAISHYEVIDTDLKNNLSIVKFILETGRTHQIRVHSKFIGHSILGDTLYGNASKLISRQALHCLKMSFFHPITNKKLNLLAPIPNDFKQIKINKPQ